MKKQYIAPDLTAVVFRAERGYAASSGLIDNVAQAINEQTEQTVASWGSPDGEQVVFGYNETGDGDDGLAAGYFGQQDVSGNVASGGWF